MYILICAPPGTGMGKALSDLKSGVGANFQFFDVETELCKSTSPLCTDPDIKPKLAQKISEGGISQVLYHLPRNKVIKYWQQVLTSILREIQTGPPERINIVSCHLTFYGDRRKEFYAPLDVGSVFNENPKPDRLVVLIDDIFDMFNRLSGPNDLYALENEDLGLSYFKAERLKDQDSNLAPF
jgi:hypothetical protein